MLLGLAVASGSLAVLWLAGAVIAGELLAAIAVARIRSKRGSRIDVGALVPAYLMALGATVAAALLLVATFVHDLSPGYALAVLSGTACMLLVLNVSRAWLAERVGTPIALS